MNIRKAERQKAKIKLAVQGPSGSGKTYGSILVAKGICNGLSKVCVIDTENNSADLYAHLGDYSVISINPPYTPEKYIEAIDLAEKEGMELIIIDSLSHSWENLLNLHSSMSGNSFANWGKITPRQKKLIQKILECELHVIATMRVKQDYVLTENSKGKVIPQKVGLKAIQRDGTEYEFTIVFVLDVAHHAKVSKDRTGLFSSRPEFYLAENIGIEIIEWCNDGVEEIEVLNKIKSAKSIQDLVHLYETYNMRYPHLKEKFASKKVELTQSLIKNNANNNGTTNYIPEENF